MANDFSRAEREVLQSLKPVTLCMKCIGLSLNDDHDTLLYRLRRLLATFCALSMTISLIAYVVLLLSDSSRASVAAFATCIHVIGYGILSCTKVLRLIHTQPVYKKLIKELMEIWPVITDNEEAAEIKRQSLHALRIGSYSFILVNVLGGIFYNGTPAAIHFYKILHGIPSDLGYAWNTVYPFDKTKPYYHELCYLYETYTTTVLSKSPVVFGVLLSPMAWLCYIVGVAIVAMAGSDLLFTSICSHITLLLRLLQQKIRSLGMSPNKSSGSVDCYEETISAIKIHQRLISYTNDTEDLFSLLNLVNVLLSSIIICFVVFNIVILEPWHVISSKFFMAAVVSEMGIMCWYADEIYRASLAVADSVYESGWYMSNPRSRRAMFMLILRAQKPICFTTMKFTNITLMTYGSILRSAYSYFALIYTMYKE